MPYKYTVFFDYNQRQEGNVIGKTRSGGWSESFYHAQFFPYDFNNIFGRWIVGRAGLLPPTIGIVGYRVQNTAQRGATHAAGIGLAGVYPAAQDVPSMAVIAWCQTQQGNWLKQVLRGTPDDLVKGGMFSPTKEYKDNFVLYALALNNFSGFVRDLSQVRAKIKSVTSTGVVLLAENLAGAANGRQVRILRTVPVTRERVSGVFTIKDFADERNFSLDGFPQVGCVGGSLRYDLMQYSQYAMNSQSIEGIIQRKAGKSPFGFRGRASRRR